MHHRYCLSATDLSFRKRFDQQARQVHDNCHDADDVERFMVFSLAVSEHNGILYALADI